MYLVSHPKSKSLKPNPNPSGGDLGLVLAPLPADNDVLAKLDAPNFWQSFDGTSVVLSFEHPPSHAAT